MNKWEQLQKVLTEIIDEGERAGFDRGQHTFCAGALYAYERVLERMERMDKKEESENENT